MLIALILLLCNCGLMSVIVANFIAPFAFRIYAKHKFYDKRTMEILENHTVTSKAFRDIFGVIFYNAKKIGIISVLATALGHASTLVVAKYLTLSEVSSYGLMVQLVGVIVTFSTTMFSSMIPQLGNLLVKRQLVLFNQKFGLSLFFYIVIFWLGSIFLFLCPPLFKFCGFNTQLPSYLVLFIFVVFKFVEMNQSLYCQLLMVGNDLSFYRSSVVNGLCAFAGLTLALKMGFGILGAIVAQFLILCTYVAWKWPVYTTKKYNINTVKDIFVTPFEILQIYIVKIKKRNI